MQHYFLPVQSQSRNSSLRSMLGLKWYGDYPISYPHALFSYVHVRKPEPHPEGAYIFGDSGGFSLHSVRTTTKIDPIDVLRWQESMCTVGCILDWPPKIAPRRIWDDPMRVTVAHTQRALPTHEVLRKSGTKFRWWGVLHGSNEEEVKQYYRAISNVYPFTDEGEGWAIRAEPRVIPTTVARSLRLLKDFAIKRAHFLAATGQAVIATLLVLGPRAGLDVVTYDSAYAVKQGMSRHVFYPNDDGLTFRPLWEGTGTSRVHRKYLLEQCHCRVCDFMRGLVDDGHPQAEKELLSDKFGGWYGTWFILHNMHMQLELHDRQVEFARRDPDGLLRQMLGKQYHSVLRIFDAPGNELGGMPKVGTERSLLDFIE